MFPLWYTSGGVEIICLVGNWEENKTKQNKPQEIVAAKSFIRLNTKSAEVCHSDVKTPSIIA